MNAGEHIRLEREQLKARIAELETSRDELRRQILEGHRQEKVCRDEVDARLAEMTAGEAVTKADLRELLLDNARLRARRLLDRKKAGQLKAKLTKAEGERDELAARVDLLEHKARSLHDSIDHARADERAKARVEMQRWERHAAQLEAALGVRMDRQAQADPETQSHAGSGTSYGAGLRLGLGHSHLSIDDREGDR